MNKQTDVFIELVFGTTLFEISQSVDIDSLPKEVGRSETALSFRGSPFVVTLFKQTAFRRFAENRRIKQRSKL